jgi:hypothetical protein
LAPSSSSEASRRCNSSRVSWMLRSAVVCSSPG